MWKNIGIATLAAPILGIALAAGGPAVSEEEPAVRECVELYFKGHATGNGDYFRQAFHPEAKLFWIKDGQFAQRTSAAFAAGGAGKPAADEAQRKRRIVLVDITHDAAVVKVDLDYPGRHLVDYLSLLKIDGRWKIVNKIFTNPTQ